MKQNKLAISALTTSTNPENNTANSKYNFMARKISTKKTWEDIALQNDIRKKFDDVIKWLQQNKLRRQSTKLNNENLH